MSETYYGGQAVIEGVMMRGESHYSVAARKADGSLVVKTESLPDNLSSKWAKRPFIRGLVGMAIMLKIGSATLKWSANLQLSSANKKLSKPVSAFTTLASTFIAIGVFLALPLFIAHLFISNTRSVGFAVAEGIIRCLFLVGYLGALNYIGSIRRLFANHGAEHKAVNCYEANLDLTVKNVQSCSRLHPRCGTGLIVFVAFVSLVLFIPLSYLPTPLLVASRLVLVPLIVTTSYEGIKILNLFKKTWIGKILIFPILATQRLTTNEPTDAQVEVAIVALQEILRLEQSGYMSALELLGSPTIIREPSLAVGNF